MLSVEQRDKIRKSFQAGTLTTRAVSPKGQVEWKRIVSTNRAEVPWETICVGSTVKGPFVLTAGHRVFINPTDKLTMQEVGTSGTGTCLLCVSLPGEVALNNVAGGFSWSDPTLGYRMLREWGEIEPRQYMYDMTVEDWHNFVLLHSGIVVSNCPDKFYHFRPPEFEGDIGQYNRIFGQIWEDAELLEYIERALDWYNMFPPNTRSLDTVDKLVTERPDWRTAILWGGIVHACFALAANWVADEFDYSIGGVSLSIEKSSKYESLKQNAEGQLDKAMEAKARTVKYIRGLQQPRFGLGIRSSFGPAVGRGVLTPRNFVVWASAFIGSSAILGVLSGMGSMLGV